LIVIVSPLFSFELLWPGVFVIHIDNVRWSQVWQLDVPDLSSLTVLVENKIMLARLLAIVNNISWTKIKNT